MHQLENNYKYEMKLYLNLDRRFIEEKTKQQHGFFESDPIYIRIEL